MIYLFPNNKPTVINNIKANILYVAFIWYLIKMVKRLHDSNVGKLPIVFGDLPSWTLIMLTALHKDGVMDDIDTCPAIILYKLVRSAYKELDERSLNV